MEEIFLGRIKTKSVVCGRKYFTTKWYNFAEDLKYIICTFKGKNLFGLNCFWEEFHNFSRSESFTNGGIAPCQNKITWGISVKDLHTSSVQCYKSFGLVAIVSEEKIFFIWPIKYLNWHWWTCCLTDQNRKYFCRGLNISACKIWFD